MRYDPIFRYRGWDRKHYKKLKGYLGHVNDHHVIPKEHKNHPLIKETKYDINSRFNLLIMPTKKGLEQLNLDPRTICHCHHPKYNKMVKSDLDIIYSSDNTEHDYQLWLYVCWLKNFIINYYIK